ARGGVLRSVQQTVVGGELPVHSRLRPSVEQEFLVHSNLAQPVVEGIESTPLPAGGVGAEFGHQQRKAKALGKAGPSAVLLGSGASPGGDGDDLARKGLCPLRLLGAWPRVSSGAAASE